MAISSSSWIAADFCAGAISVWRCLLASTALATATPAALAAQQEQEPQPTAYLYEVSVGAKSGFINQQVELVIPAQYSSARAFHQGLAAVGVASKDVRGNRLLHWLFINRAGEDLFDPRP